MKAVRLAVAAMMFLMAASIAVGAKKQPTEPDYTKGEVLKGRYAGKNFDYMNLGPIGSVGCVWADKEFTKDTRMIRVKEVLAGSPAEGVLKVGDVILGVGEEKFSSDARKAISQAITDAETKKGGGKLNLLIWRPEPDSDPVSGTEKTVTITLPVMGRYSETSPWNCEKSKRIIDNACQYIVKRGFYQQIDEGKPVPGRGIPALLEALGLLATGEDKYRPMIQEYARAISPRDLQLEIEGLSSWYSSYTLLFLSEYYLATKDEVVLPAIQEYATKIAMGRSGVGTWSHGMAKPSWNGGKLYGKASAYGSMNQVGLTCTIALLLARECGVQSDEVDTAIRLSTDFFRYFAEKGAIPYGDHTPNPNHDNNGVNSQAAVMFDLAGEAGTASYFTRTALASYTIRELGHTGHFFAWQWGAPGAARGGKRAAQSFIENTRWFVELERRPDGSFIYQPQLNNKDHGKYLGWSTTGSRLIQFCLPRKALRITGRGRACMSPLTESDIKEAVAAGVYAPDQKTSTGDLLKALGSRWPYVREKAAEALGQRDDDVVQKLIAMLDGHNRYARYGACNALYYAGRRSAEAVDALIAKVSDPQDMDLRFHAVQGLRVPKSRGKYEAEAYERMLGEAARKAGPALLRLTTLNDPENDPGRKLHNEIATILFYSGNVRPFIGHYPKGKGLDTVDRQLLLAVIRSLLTNPNGNARTLVSRVYPVLTAAEIESLWGDIYRSTANEAPSGVMMSNGDRFAGLDLMAEHGVKEGIPLAIDIGLRQKGWGSKARLSRGVPPLLTYGGALKGYLPEINQVLQEWGSPGHKRSKEDAEEFRRKLTEALKGPEPKLVSIEEYIKD